jgi:hypothetical protein
MRSKKAKGRKQDPNPLAHCAGEGREIPGVLPHVFFWTHTGIQSMATVGLSRVNNIEAEMACGLAQYLVTVNAYDQPGLPDGIFSNKNPNLGKFWRAFEWKMIVYYVPIWILLWPFGVYGHTS